MEKDPHNKKISLENLKKKNIHQVPEGYFDKLPYSIQEKIQGKKRSWTIDWKNGTGRYAIPGLAILILAFFIYLALPSGKQEIAVKPIKEVTKDSITSNAEDIQEKEPVITQDNDMTAIQQKPIAVDSNMKKQDIPVVIDKFDSPESYLADITNDDIKEYLDLNEMDDVQVEELLID
ncbi:MAG: hypothetical protein ACJ75J_08525 [Cytophagaceae bacterium]